VPDWRWSLDRENCPWYPTMRLFRQPQRDDWASVFSKIEVELRAALPRDASAMNSHSYLPATPTIQISWGELIDKITILEIKEQRLGTREAAEKAQYQLALVMDVARDVLTHQNDLVALKTQ
jgi:hypothetical protein